MKVKSDHTKRFPPHDFLQVGLSSQTSRINNKGDISTFHDWQKTPVAAILFLKIRPKIFPDNILWLLIYTANLRKLAIIFFFIRAVMVKSLSTHCGYPVDLQILISKLENLISKLNFYKLISYLVDRCICPAHSRSRQTLEKNASSWALARTGSVLFTRQVAV